MTQRISNFERKYQSTKAHESGEISHSHRRGSYI
uniref:Uncharacterized protein n=1 Tax=Anguilla anguilla TaxID=7936 RepID=A0A0E9PCC0_ANGAN